MRTRRRAVLTPPTIRHASFRAERAQVKERAIRDNIRATVKAVYLTTALGAKAPVK
jgi:hypothetical protein